MYREIHDKIRDLYLNDGRPWIIGFSGGKDSTCVTQMVFWVLKELPEEKRNKEVYVISNDTLVENPVIEERIDTSLKKMKKTANKNNLPISVKKLTPDLSETYWVNLIGRGYPSPNKYFRWCTDRLKIKPTTHFIEKKVNKNGEVIVLLGARRVESATRAETMKKYEVENFNLRKHSDIANAFIFTPIEDLNNNSVWAYLKQVENPWGEDNDELIHLYRKADGSCPMQIDKTTKHCGNSRFGCWVCTLVTFDKSTESLIENGEDWMKPLLDFRDWLKKIRNDDSYRNAMRKNDKKRKIKADQIGKDFQQTKRYGHKVLGPFTFEARYEILRKLLKLQRNVAKRIPKDKNSELISPEELKAIETVWTYEGAPLTSISEVTGKEKKNNYVEKKNNHLHLSKQKANNICEKNNISPKLLERFLIVEEDLTSLSRRHGLYERLEKILENEARREFSGEKKDEV